MQATIRNSTRKTEDRVFPGWGFRGWRQLLANRGPWATARAAATRLKSRLGGKGGATLPSELWRSPGLLPMQAHPFDRRYGTETSGLVWGESMPTGHAHDIWNTAYYGIAPSIFTRALESLRTREVLDLRRFTFIDLGAGKGRAVLLASQLPLARVVGVELVPELLATARKNQAHFKRFSEQQTSSVDLLLADAGNFPWAAELAAPLEGPLLLFLYNPFSRPVLRLLLHRLHAWLANSTETAAPTAADVYLLYINPEQENEILRQPVGRQRPVHPFVIRKLWEETVAIGEEDRLADRFGSTCETFAAYRFVRTSEFIS